MSEYLEVCGEDVLYIPEHDCECPDCEDLNLQVKTGVTPATASQTITADPGYDGLKSVEINPMPAGELAAPSISVDGNGLITATAGVSTAGYLDTSETKSNTAQLSTQAAATITPTGSDQTAVAANKYTTGAVDVEGVVCENLLPENIVSGVTVKVGTATDDDSVTSVTGTATGGGIEVKEVTFYDYDGTIAYAYTAEEFLALASMPVVPTHSDLTSDGWNWSYADARTWVTKYGMLAIGNIVHPSDGSTRIIVNPKSGESITISRVSGTWSGTIDWGDGETTAISVSQSHTYATAGHYIIRIITSVGNSYSVALGGDINMVDEVNLGSSATANIGANMNYGCNVLSFPHGLTTIGINFMNGLSNLRTFIIPSTVTDVSHAYYDRVKAMSFPNVTYSSVPVSASAPIYTIKATTANTNGNSPLPGIKYLVLSDECTTMSSTQRWRDLKVCEKMYLSPNISSMGGECVTNLFSLKKLVVPSAMTSTNNFTNIASLEEVTLPPNVTSVSGFTNAFMLESLSFPATVTTIGNNAFSNARSLRELHFYPTAPPTVGGTGALSNLNSTCVIYVPYSADHSILGAYQAASNLSRYASQMVEEPE